ncbi:uncharacterized protein LOC107784835 [Nicotiana tabacum]|uniref:Uncharacterized protein LOC107784835 n=1 Tax=Nicotiana tabacum TaxID=4097 RepID=A0A1S3ZAR3_TOBAC|nr:uncharacterized protein LOC104089213 [Nicotiana tomentosiformis]XP_016461506.1 PREDICTED: uncharacterized protein LOC107784835 [Nicotiana tabacum]
MGVKVATTCLQWNQSFVSHSSSSSSSQTLASAISSPSSKRRSISSRGSLICRYVHRLDQSALFGTQFLNLQRSQSCEQLKPRTRTITRASSTSASLDSFSDEEFSKEIQELALKFQLSDVENQNTTSSQLEAIADSIETSCEIVTSGSDIKFLENQKPFDPLEQPDWSERDEIIPANIEWRANSVDLPFSLRIIKRKKQWRDGVREAGESAYCSVKKAFSNMVFIIRELQSYTMQMREMLFYEDLQGILVRVQKEMHASFVWLFQQVFSHTPTLMVYVMILLANYSVHSMANSAAIAATPPPLTETVSTLEESNFNQKFDTSAIKTFSVSSSSGKVTSIGGSNGGGGNYKPIASGNDGDGGLSSNYYTVIPDGISSNTRISEEEGVSGQETREEELKLWDSIVDEASKMQAATRDEALDHETMQRFVSPIYANIEVDDYADYFRTELLYQMGLNQEPQNTLLLANYAQFLFLVAQDYDRAEEYFKKASKVEPKDAEALNKYATFLWQVRKDLWAAEETFLEAIAAEPSNSFYAANYANFLWNTGGEDTCYPLDSSNTDV